MRSQPQPGPDERLTSSSPARPRTALVRALTASAVLHVVAIAALGVFVGAGGAGRGAPFEGTPIVATLPRPLPSPAVQPPSPPTSTLSPSLPAETSAPLPVPLRPTPTTASARGSRQGQATINESAPDQPVDAATERLIAQAAPDAVRGTLEFDVPPRGIYPLAAVEKRLQVDMLVPVLVREDGRVEVVEGTIHDPVFAPVIAAGLKDARAKPAMTAEGRTVPLWGLLSYAFEFVGDRPEAK